MGAVKNRGPGPGGRGGVSRRFRRCLPLYIMTLPGLIYFLINNYIPMSGIIIAFKNVNWLRGIWGSKWVGFSNFEYLFKTREAWIITRNTIGYNLAFIVLGTVLAITVAVLLNEIRSKFLKQFYQTIFLLPYLISIVVVSYLVYAMLSVESGFVNKSIFSLLGKEPVQWYSEQAYWPGILIIVHIWKSFGYNCIIYYATIVGIDHGYYEAAVIDGASRWQQIRFITIPCLTATITTLTLFAIGRIFYSDFGLFYQVPLDAGPLYDVTNTIDTYVYRGLIRLNDIGMSSAAGVYQSLIGFLLVLGTNYVVSRVNRDNSLF